MSHVISSACDREDLIGASLFDYPNLRGRLLAFKGSVPNREEDLPGGDLPSTNTHLPLTYSKTLDFLTEKGDADLIEVLLEIVETINKWGLDSSASAKFPDRTDKDIKIAEKSVEKYKHSIERLAHDVETWKDTSADTSNAEAVLAKAMDTLSMSSATVETMHNSRVSIQRFQSAPAHMVERVTNSMAHRFQHSSFFVTEGGLPGVGTPGVRDFRAGDALVWLDDMLFPIVLREVIGSEGFGRSLGRPELVGSWLGG
ncbi:hypothetical protein DL95DRAFT_463358 [Leptodontidium sp. 2 PMI_412]|nr:hypothetical protein DL95DRAFT_463358 [Leptodontidium sp. 2 PMI_412]